MTPRKVKYRRGTEYCKKYFVQEYLCRMKKKLIELKSVSKAFDGETILAGIDLDIHDKEFVTLLGPSGCGKTTTLRIIGGFATPDSGEVLFEGKSILNIPSYKRPVNTVFQRYALFPHLNVFENVAFGLRIQKKSNDEIRRKVGAMLEMVNLGGYESRSISTLSGGQQQRVAIARALVNEPRVLLLDEPLGALDLKMRQDMQYELKNIHKQAGITFIYVTHDQEEALTLSDTIAIMNQGVIQQIGSPEDIYNEPRNAFVADFIGDSNIIDGIMVKDLLVNILGVNFPCVDTGFGTDSPVDVVIRPEDVILVSPDQSQMTGVVTSLMFKGVHYEMDVMANGYEWLVHSTKMEPVGARVGIYVEPENIQIMHKPRSEDEEVSSADDE